MWKNQSERSRSHLSLSSIGAMSQSKFLLNPNAAPFVPHFKSTTMNSKGESMDTKISDEESWRRIHHIHGQKDHVSQSEIIGIEKQLDMEVVLEFLGVEKHDMEDGAEFVTEYLSAMFPKMSLESLNEVYCLCGADLDETVNMLQQLEGYDDNADSRQIPQNGSRTADPSSSEVTSVEASRPSGSSESAVALDQEPVYTLLK